jgi:hypothetical protein
MMSQRGDAARGAQAPGFQRVRIGDLLITALYDGFVPILADDLHGEPAAEVSRLLADGFMPPTMRTATRGCRSPLHPSPDTRRVLDWRLAPNVARARSIGTSPSLPSFWMSSAARRTRKALAV